MIHELLKSLLVLIVLISCTVSGQTAPAADTETGSIKGRIRTLNGRGIGKVGIRVFDSEQNLIIKATSNPSGAYEIPGIPGGTYKIYFTTFSTRESYLSQWYENGDSVESAAEITVNKGVVHLNYDTILRPAGTISGQVTDRNHVPIHGVTVMIYDWENHLTLQTQTDVDGKYRAGSLPGGIYKLRFETDSTLGNYQPQFYNQTPDLFTTPRISVAEGKETGNINTQLSAGGAIIGQIMDDRGNAVSAAEVLIFDLKRRLVGTCYSDGQGNFAALGLPVGYFKLQFLAGSRLSGYQTSWYNDQNDFETAGWVTVSAGNFTSGIQVLFKAEAADTFPSPVTNTDNKGCSARIIISPNWRRPVVMIAELSRKA